MALSVTSKWVDQVAEITLAGELDASTAPQFQAELVKAAEQKVKRLVLFTSELKYIASAGVRMLIFAKQKMGTNVAIYLIAPQDQIIETMQRAGLMNSVIVQPEYKP
jgi:anti-anti-sigma factor